MDRGQHNLCRRERPQLTKKGKVEPTLLCMEKEARVGERAGGEGGAGGGWGALCTLVSTLEMDVDAVPQEWKADHPTRLQESYNVQSQ